MFTSGFQEETSGHVQIDDVDTSTVEKLLNYMYTGQLSAKEITRQEIKLLVAADKYEVLELKDNLESQLCKLLVNKCRLDALRDVLLADDKAERTVAVNILDKTLFTGRLGDGKS
ncbi:unnamed protein product [Closterium sp. Naga37s-1]|nr:unnamed protein product [Closterium sp. Naga37s-1]